LTVANFFKACMVYHLPAVSGWAYWLVCGDLLKCRIMSSWAIFQGHLIKEAPTPGYKTGTGHTWWCSPRAS